MKYGIINDRKQIKFISDTIPSGDVSYIQLTNAEAVLAQSYIISRTPPFKFNGTITTIKKQQELGKMVRWNAELNDFAEVQPIIKIPRECPAWRIKAIAKLTPHGSGTLYDAVGIAISMLEEPTKTVANTVWNEGNTIERQSSMVSLIATSCELSYDDIDDIFIRAAALSV